MFGICGEIFVRVRRFSINFWGRFVSLIFVERISRGFVLRD